MTELECQEEDEDGIIKLGGCTKDLCSTDLNGDAVWSCSEHGCACGLCNSEIAPPIPAT